MDKKIFYYAGLSSVISYILGDIIGGFITPNYNYIKNAVSELVQSGAENRFFISTFLFIHALMIILFSIGILINYPFKKNKLVFVGGLLYLIVGISHALSSSIFPQDPVGTESSFPGIMHLILVGITVVLIFFILPLFGIGFYKYKRWKFFCIFTFICLPIIIISGVLSPIFISRGIQVMGITERICAYTFYLWIIILSLKLILEKPKRLLI